MFFYPSSKAAALYRVRLLEIFAASAFLAAMMLRPAYSAACTLFLFVAYLAMAWLYIPALLKRSSFTAEEGRVKYCAGLLLRREILLDLDQVYQITEVRTPAQRALGLTTAILRPCGPSVRINWLTNGQAAALKEEWREAYEK